MGTGGYNKGSSFNMIMWYLESQNAELIKSTYWGRRTQTEVCGCCCQVTSRRLCGRSRESWVLATPRLQTARGITAVTTTRPETCRDSSRQMLDVWKLSLHQWLCIISFIYELEMIMLLLVCVVILALHNLWKCDDIYINFASHITGLGETVKTSTKEKKKKSEKKQKKTKDDTKEEKTATQEKSDSDADSSSSSSDDGESLWQEVFSTVIHHLISF